MPKRKKGKDNYAQNRTPKGNASRLEGMNDEVDVSGVVKKNGAS